MLEPLAAGYPRPTSVHFRCEQRFFFQKRLIIDRAESHRGIHAYGNRSFCPDFFCMNTDAYHPNGPI